MNASIEAETWGFITEWRAHAPWAADAQVEQDLVICARSSTSRSSSRPSILGFPKSALTAVERVQDRAIERR